MSTNKMGAWRPGAILTASGRMVCPLDPDPDLIVIEDIAHALGKLCRFTGHARRMYTVAEHTCLGFPFVPDEHKMQWLLHDATEAYLGDVAGPLKATYVYQDYRAAEDRLWHVIADKFGVDRAMSLPVREIDARMLAVEMRDLMPDHDDVEGNWVLPISIAPWNHENWGVRLLEEFYLIDDIRKAKAAGLTVQVAG